MVASATGDDAPSPRATLGCVLLPTDLTFAEEGPAVVERTPGVRLRTARLELDGDSIDVANFESARGRIGRAAAALGPVDVVGLACTSLSFALGRDAVRRELHAAQPAARATDMASALLAALDATGAPRVAVVTPYVDELHGRLLRLLAEHGLEVVSDRALGLRTDVEMSAVSAAELHDLARRSDAADAEAVVLACSAFRACGPGFLDTLEHDLGKPVVTSQQAFLWHMLRTAGVDDALDGFGALLRRAPSPSTPS